MNKVYAVAMRKGGQAKSTTVSTLARLCAMQGARVLVVDLAQPGSATTSFRDLWPEVDHGDLAHALLALRGVPAGALPAPKACAEALGARALPVRLRAQPSWGGGRIDVLPHDDLIAEAAGYLQSDLIVAGLLRALAGDYDLALLDAPADGVALLTNALAATACVLLPLVPEAPALQGADATLRLLARLRRTGHAVALGGILLTRCDPRSKRAGEVVRTLTQSGEVEGEVLHRKLFPFAVRLSEYYEQAFRQGVAVWDRVEDAAHWSGYALLAEWLLRDAGLPQMAETPRLAMRLEPGTRVLDSLALGLARPEIEFQAFAEARNALSL
ncbi:MAG TPA: ParA family protein [Ktedonobacterales bacterium]|nr:ParA family protein [Ktedonobacterales bacterium]